MFNSEMNKLAAFLLNLYRKFRLPSRSSPSQITLYHFALVSEIYLVSMQFSHLIWFVNYCFVNFAFC